jgi:predicted O-methyltransferase YrrM
MAQESTAFDHSTPALYDRYMGPLLFEPYARLIAGRAAMFHPSRILETAAGTGIVSRTVNEAVPQAQIVAIERRDPSSLDRAVNAVTEALRPWDGKDAPMSSHVVTATKPG